MPNQLNKSVLAVLEQLQKMSLPGPVTVFGSVARGEATAASDLDVVVDMGETTTSDVYCKADVRRSVAPLLYLGRRYYGSFDPFLKCKDGLLARSDESNGWISAKRARSILANAKADGVSLAAVEVPSSEEVQQEPQDSPEPMRP